MPCYAMHMHTHMHPAIMMMAMTKMMTKKIMTMMTKMVHVALERGGGVGVSKRGMSQKGVS